MADVAISVAGLGKQYLIGGPRPAYRTLRETLTDAVATPFRRGGRLLRGQAYGASDATEVIWALRDVSFEVEQGEVVGIIGRNGAGKTTLLRVLSRITGPTEGAARVSGRVAALLNVGTGFHPELTGRENIYLNGAILGMGKSEINRKFDEIVAFSEVEKFIDTPVKRYSSGMKVRLAFAVAAHLEPDILVVDEVLAVGDHAFQQKCIGKMENVAGQGRTVLYVSHRLDTVEALCSRCILLEDGRISSDGESRPVIDAYYSSLAQTQATTLRDRSDREGRGRFRFVDTWVEDEYGNRVQTVSSGRQVRFVMSFEIGPKQETRELNVGVAIHKLDNTGVTDMGLEEIGQRLDFSGHKDGRLECIIPKLPLNGGAFYYNLMARSRAPGKIVEDYIQHAGTFEVRPGPFFDGGTIVPEHVFMLIDHSWDLIGIGEPDSDSS